MVSVLRYSIVEHRLSRRPQPIEYGLLGLDTHPITHPTAIGYCRVDPSANTRPRGRHEEPRRDFAPPQPRACLGYVYMFFVKALTSIMLCRAATPLFARACGTGAPQCFWARRQAKCAAFKPTCAGRLRPGFWFDALIKSSDSVLV